MGTPTAAGACGDRAHTRRLLSRPAGDAGGGRARLWKAPRGRCRHTL